LIAFVRFRILYHSLCVQFYIFFFGSKLIITRHEMCVRVCVRVCYLIFTDWSRWESRAFCWRVTVWINKCLYLLENANDSPWQHCGNYFAENYQFTFRAVAVFAVATCIISHFRAVCKCVLQDPKKVTISSFCQNIFLLFLLPFGNYSNIFP